MRISTIIAILCCLLITGGALLAFVLIDDPPFKWANNELPREIRVNSAGHSSVTDVDGGVTEILDAINGNPDGWNNAGAGNLVDAMADPSPPVSLSDGVSTMHFNVTGTGCSGSCLAVTLTPIPPTSPNETVNGVTFSLMTDSDIFFNPSTKFYSDSENNGCRREIHIESVAVHEVGHLLGLGHTPVNGATMYAFTGQCATTGETLAQDDVDGINCIYNNGAGCGGCVGDTLIVDSTACSQPSSGPNAGDFVVETYIVDNCGSAATGASVQIEVDSPTGPLFCQGETDSGGRLGCALDNPPDGTYMSTVSSVAKSGFTWPGNECGGGSSPCECSIDIGGGSSGDCGNGVCGTGESCDGRNGTTACPADCDGRVNGKPSNRYCYVEGVCEGPGCP